MENKNKKGKESTSIDLNVLQRPRRKSSRLEAQKKVINTFICSYVVVLFINIGYNSLIDFDGYGYIFK